MTYVDKTPPGQHEFIAFEFDLPHSPQKVWRALTDPALLEQWLLPLVAPGGFAIEPGTAFTLTAPPQPGWDGIVNCQYVDVEPGRMISWRWVVGDIDTVVTFTLEPAATGTRLSLVQSGFKPAQKQNAGGARYGWKMMGGKLADLLGRIA
jgi:uncharacterized protein YndB with AHSA1/START domain